MIDLTSKLGEINNIDDHNKGSKIYPQNQVILEYIMPSIPLKAQVFKYHSDTGHCFSWKEKWSLRKSKKKKYCFSLFGKTDI